MINEKPVEFIPVIELEKRLMGEDLASIADDQECFGWLFRDPEEGLCPEDGVNGDLCALRYHCHKVWNKVQDNKVATNSYIKITNKKGIKKRKKKKGKPIRKKWGGNRRRVYMDLGRPVDNMVRAFVNEFGMLPTFPLSNPNGRIKKYGGLGTYIWSKPTHYHALYYDGITIVRFRTIEKCSSIVDIVPEMVSELNELSLSLGSFYGNKLHIKPPRKIGEKVLHLWRPCTHKVTVRSELGAIELAKAYIKKFNIKVANKSCL